MDTTMKIRSFWFFKLAHQVSSEIYTILDEIRRASVTHRVTGAGGGNRTRVASLEGWSFTIKLRPQKQVIYTSASGLLILRDRFPICAALGPAVPKCHRVTHPKFHIEPG
jgi:hypothetical protein